MIDLDATEPYDSLWGFRSIAWIMLALVFLGLCAFAGQTESGQNQWQVYLVLFVLCVLLVYFLPRMRSRWFSIGAILTVAILSRLLFFTHPASDDMNRYRWEGHIQNHGISPYQVAPQDPALETLRTDYWNAINHPDWRAVYPPGMELVLRLLDAVCNETWFFKSFFLLFDIASLLLVYCILMERRLPLRYSLWYAINPLVLYAFSAEAHLDALLVFFLLLVLLLSCRHRWATMAFALGLAIQVKWVAVVIVPFVFNRTNRNYLWITVLTFLVPFCFFPGSLLHMIQNVLRFGLDLHWQGWLHQALVTSGLKPETSSWLCLFFLAAGLTWILRSRSEPLKDSGRALAWLILCLPTFHYWYLTWILPWLVWAPRLSWMLLSGTVCVAFITSWQARQTGQWQHSITLYLVQWLPFTLLFLRPPWRSRLYPPVYPKPQTIGVVIPTWNDGPALEACLHSLAACCPAPDQVLVVDGGSTDASRQIATQNNIPVIDGGGGRGGQIQAGIARLQTDLIFICHADATLHPDALGDMLDVCRANPTVAGGALGQRFMSHHPVLRVLELLNDLRATLGQISFGDQGQFFRRSALREMNGYAAIPLMEDVELSFRMTRAGDVVYCFGGLLSSPRRWSGLDIFPKMMQVVCLVAWYSLRRLWNRDTRDLYHWYYGRPAPLPRPDDSNGLS